LEIVDYSSTFPDFSQVLELVKSTCVEPHSSENYHQRLITDIFAHVCCFKGQRLKVVDSQPASESFIPASILSTTGTSANGISVSVHARSVVPNQGCLHPLQMRDIIAGVARSVRLNDTKFSHLLLS